MDDISKLEVELNQMIESDKLYWMRNEAKCRAARQHVSYEEFDQIVKASHLKPLSKGDHLDVDRGDKVFNSKKESMPKVCRVNKLACQGTTNAPRIIKRKEDQDGPISLEAILSQFQRIRILQEKDEGQELKAFLESLQLLTQRPRFELEWSMATPTEKREAVESLKKVKSLLALEEREKFSRLWHLFEK